MFLMCFTLILGWVRRILGWAGPTCPPPLAAPLVDPLQSKKLSTPLEKILIHGHIARVPVKTSHYSSTEYHYLNSDLTGSTTYSMFREKYPDSNIKYEFHNKIFKDGFDLQFGRPQVDTCCTCVSLSIKLKVRK
jgi:hypothetical protein